MGKASNPIQSKYGAVSPSETEGMIIAEGVTKVDNVNSPPTYQDVPFSIAFYIHLVIMGIYLGYQISAEKDYLQVDTDEDVQLDKEFWTNVQLYSIRILGHLVFPLSGVLSFVLVLFSCSTLLPNFPKAMVIASLLTSLVWCAVISIFLLVTTPMPVPLVAATVTLAIAFCYLRIVWKYIPFAAAHLAVAMKGISMNWGLFFLSLIASALSLAWTIIWVYGTFGFFYSMNENKATDDTDESDASAEQAMDTVIMFLLTVSFYWTQLVIMNTLQVTVAGVVGTWLFHPSEASSCCSPAVGSSLYRSLTYSFGSICFGSLLNAIISALRALAQNARQENNRENGNPIGGLLLCIVECILNLLEDIIEYFNKWAYIYVGLYGNSYLESGRKVIELFQARGWITFITNSVASQVLGIIAFVVSIIAGFAGVLVESASRTSDESYYFGTMDGPQYWAFGICFFFAMIVTSVMMNVGNAAINTVIVCYAEDPAIMEKNHPRLVRLLSLAWSSVYPESGVVATAQEPQYEGVV
mmetsp:Transcript_5739/g.8801  ORF Transcript_5739/g.8801 Transcript_5739/m.8801 type:complete len:526 (+) Transcript_5739:159-1736(+)|eukprot:CAMPEP_0118694686 /NCGR_PEP_ID=MMETSP0800-20121206/12698_1 /TAXON_ID=210618 ORGANISM="Striatella unipunctata, Strain CCMP2910" /NCGR_SAMPLE_ID=MMETSP0800 /ASSEMBLY_ACC=CAM_ASM_000638 /LENGTH=525 /DNA_ID=CAMNT_0006593253 /DNA_START=157 /DNA_END=1734 /DNA_ORIENTATION=+